MAINAAKVTEVLHDEDLHDEDLRDSMGDSMDGWQGITDDGHENLNGLSGRNEAVTAHTGTDNWKA